MNLLGMRPDILRWFYECAASAVQGGPFICVRRHCWKCDAWIDLYGGDGWDQCEGSCVIQASPYYDLLLINSVYGKMGRRPDGLL
jgi:hypothetical protein